MCGINGLVDFNFKFKDEQRVKIVHEMNQKIEYRGPDQEGMYSNEYLAMGMRRLSIIDLSTGNQPIFNENHSIAVVFNGEIYNFQTLRQNLIQRGHKFLTKTDTEIIAHGYEEYGTDIFKQLDGMFALSIYDQTAKKLVLARDRMGEKPLYYFYNSEIFVYGSELKSLLSTDLFPLFINKKALNQFFQLTYIPAPLSIYENVYKLEPGTFIEISMDKNICKRSFWSLKDTLKTGTFSYEQSKNRLYSLLFQSIQHRMVSDVPVGVFLSGGIDSAIVTALMANISDNPVNTFTIGFEEKEYDERNRAKLIAELYHTNHHDYLLNYRESLPILNRILENIDEPFADSSVLPTYFVSQCAAKEVKVVLTGDAADELFLGYNKYLILYYKALYSKFPRILRKKIIEPIIKRLPDKNNLTRKLNKVIFNMEKEGFSLWKNMMSNAFKENELSMLFQEEFYQPDSLAPIEKLYNEINTCNELEKVQYVDLKVILEGDMLTKVDRMSMLNSVEVRTPMLSQDIIKFSMSLPMDFKLSKKKLKRILKDTFGPLFPKGFEKLPKSGFGVPIDYWFRTDLKAELEAVLSKDLIEKQGIFNYEFIKLVLDEHFSEVKNRKNELWALYVFQKWYLKIQKG